VDLDRQAIERRDFPITRRGYDPSAVDAHLRALAVEMAELSRREGGGAEHSLATAAGSQVQNILQAAEKAAADIERDAQQRADEVRSEAADDARDTREQAIAKAREHLAAVAQATAALQQRVASIDGEAKALLEHLRGGADRLASDLLALDANMGKLYDAASGRPASPAQAGSAPDSAPPPAASPAKAGSAPDSAAPPAAARAPRRRAPLPSTPTASAEPTTPAPAERADAGAEATPAPAERADAGAEPTPAPTPASAEPQASSAGGAAPQGNGDVDGARLVALNMALSGESREATDRYLAEHFRLAERSALIDEVYAAIEV
jgi:hypothetical protein